MSSYHGGSTRREVGLVLSSQILVVVLGVLVFGMANVEDNTYITSATVDILFALSVILSVFTLQGAWSTTGYVQLASSLLVLIMVGVALGAPDTHQAMSFVVPLLFIVAVGVDVFFWKPTGIQAIGVCLLAAVIVVVVSAGSTDQYFMQREGALVVSFLFWSILLIEIVLLLHRQPPIRPDTTVRVGK